MASLRERVSKPAQLAFYDSLHKQVRPFELPEGQDVVRWYSCGPTVYDASHMGHARNYVTTDTLRRLMKDYFQFDVRYVQNITDVDDKIIIKARQNLLFERYRAQYEQGHDWRNQKAQIVAWWEAYRQKFLGHVETGLADWLANVPLKRDISAYPKDQMVIDTLTASAQVLSSLPPNAHEFFDATRDIIIFGIDTSDQLLTNEDMFASFKDLTQYWEKKFDEDMDNLNVLKPDKVVRVTEYMDEIIHFVQQIIRNGFAYDANGSVYFNVAAFMASGHDYAKLKPSSMSSTTEALLAEGEGSLSAQISHAKRSQRDFALWKASKLGEPFWPSPWGNGRPGWHIECSAMASCEFGSSMDIHSGGEDLTFPHHDNELAQSEAAHGCHEWVRYFLHTGHLHIDGMKMSKSLKNFLTIEHVLTARGMTSRALRLMFLSGNWRGRVDYSDDLTKGVRSTEQKFTEFFTQVRALKQSTTSAASTIDEALLIKLQESRDQVDAALAYDFDTPKMLNILRELLSEANKTLSASPAPLLTLLEVVEYLTHLFEIVGIEAAEDRIGWSLDSHNRTAMLEAQTIAGHRLEIRKIASEAATSDKPLDVITTARISQIMQKLNALSISTPELSKFRSELDATLSHKPSQKAVMEELDKFRDDTLAELGIALDDKKDSFILKPGNKQELLLKSQQKKEAKNERIKKQEEAAKKEAELMERGRVRAADLFKSGTEYTQFDAKGMPTHVKNEQGEEVEVTKSQSKKLAKLYANQEKLNQKYDEWLIRTNA